jgi:hypothetical protein
MAGLELLFHLAFPTHFRQSCLELDDCNANLPSGRRAIAARRDPWTQPLAILIDGQLRPVASGQFASTSNEVLSNLLITLRQNHLPKRLLQSVETP